MKLGAGLMHCTDQLRGIRADVTLIDLSARGGRHAAARRVIIPSTFHTMLHTKTPASNLEIEITEAPNSAFSQIQIG